MRRLAAARLCGGGAAAVAGAAAAAARRPSPQRAGRLCGRGLGRGLSLRQSSADRWRSALSAKTGDEPSSSRRQGRELFARGVAVGLVRDRGGDAEAHRQHEAHGAAASLARRTVIVQRRRGRAELGHRDRLAGRDAIGEVDVQIGRIMRRARHRIAAKDRDDVVVRIGLRVDVWNRCVCIGAPAVVGAAGGRHRALTRARQYGGNDGAGELFPVAAMA